MIKMMVEFYMNYDKLVCICLSIATALHSKGKDISIFELISMNLVYLVCLCIGVFFLHKICIWKYQSNFMCLMLSYSMYVVMKQTRKKKRIYENSMEMEQRKETMSPRKDDFMWMCRNRQQHKYRRRSTIECFLCFVFIVFVFGDCILPINNILKSFDSIRSLRIYFQYERSRFRPLNAQCTLHNDAFIY